jgi:hypothetical protein
VAAVRRSGNAPDNERSPITAAGAWGLVPKVGTDAKAGAEICTGQRAMGVAIGLVESGARENGRFQRGTVPAADRRSSSDSGWAKAMERAGVVLDNAPELADRCCPSTRRPLTEGWPGGVRVLWGAPPTGQSAFGGAGVWFAAGGAGGGASGGGGADPCPVFNLPHTSMPSCAAPTAAPATAAMVPTSRCSLGGLGVASGMVPPFG